MLAVAVQILWFDTEDIFHHLHCFTCSWFNVAWRNMKLFTQTTTVAQFISPLHLRVYRSCWIWRLLKWHGTCPCYKMIHPQVRLSASQASSRWFAVPLPRWAKAPHLLRLQRHCLTFLPYDFASQGRGLSIPLNPSQTGFDGVFVHYMSQLHPTEKNMHSLLYQLWSKIGKKSKLGTLQVLKKEMGVFAQLCWIMWSKIY